MGILGNNIGQKIKRARYEKNMTQEELAGNNFNRSFLSQIEKGLVKPSDRVLSIIADRLDLPLSFFYEPEDPDQDDEQAIAALNEAEQLITTDNIEAAQELIAGTLKLHDISPKYAGLLMKLQGEANFQGNNINKALSSLKKAKIILSDHKYHHELCRVLNYLGELNNQIEAFQDGHYYLQQALNIIDDNFVNDSILRLDLYYNQAISYIGLTEYQKGVELLITSLSYSTKINNYYNYGELQYLLGQCYYGMDELGKARQSYETAIDQFVIFNKYEYTGKAQQALGEIEECQNQLADAERLYRAALKQFQSSGDESGVENIKLKLLKIYLKSDDKNNIIKLAPFNTERIESITEKILINYQLSKVYYSEDKNIDQCFSTLQNLNDLVDRARRKKMYSDQQLLFYYSWMAHLYLNLEYYELGRKCLKQCNSIIKKLRN